jgi:GT2 family glycosyltransferase
MAKLLIVIVNYRTPKLAIDCLRTLEEEIRGLEGVRVVVTDNASPDDSVAQISAAVEQNGWKTWCDFVPLQQNGGFAYGNNEGIRWAAEHLRPADGGVAAPIGNRQSAIGNLPFDYVYLLNPDTLVLAGAVRELLKFMDAHPKCGIAGGRAENPDGSVRRSVFRFHSVLGEVEGTLRFGQVSKVLKSKIVAPPVPDDAAPADWVSGASMIVRREVIEQVGLLDDGYFMYFEETDYCLRAKRAGWEVWYVPQSRIIHLVGQSSGVTGAQRAVKRRPKYWFDSRHRYFRKNHGILPTLLADMLWTVNFPISRAMQFVRRQPRVDPPHLWWDFVRYNVRSWFGGGSPQGR